MGLFISTSNLKGIQVDDPNSINLPTVAETELEARRMELADKIGGRTSGKYARILLAALSGIPWVGSVLAATATYTSEEEQGQLSELVRLWLEEHQAKLNRLSGTLGSVVSRLEGFGEEFQERIQSDEYLGLVRKAFRSWDQADTDEKREFIRKLLGNAGGTKLCSDDLIRLFISWIDAYHESHFAVIRVIYKSPGATRAEIWQEIHGVRVREDSAEADLFKLLIRDLSTGSVIRQHREVDFSGNFIRKPTVKSAAGRSPVVKSAFDSTERYELTELGKQFVHYTMEDVVTQIAAG